jgi:adenylate cyclase
VLMIHGESPRSKDILEPAPVDEVTLVFTDIESSTTLWEKASVAMNTALEQHDLTIRTLLSKFRGYEVKTEGDAFFVAFFTVLDAIKWALAVQEALLRLSWPKEILDIQAGNKVVAENGALIYNGLRVRMGIHVGFPNCRRNPTTNRMDYYGKST